MQFADLGLVVVDEQHRFGVEQRDALRGKAGAPPHVLVMTATPIPRTVAMTVFGDLDTSTLTELPAGRGDVQTTVVPTAGAAGVARPRLAAGARGGRRRAGRPTSSARGSTRRRATPSDPSERPLHAVEELRARARRGRRWPGCASSMLHGRMAPDEKDRVMRAFAAGEVDVLVATTVIEVGVDVPNATVMVILDADRFGVSQLHQLRGRIGRGGHAGLCLLVSAADPASPSMERLLAVAATRDGFELSRDRPRAAARGRRARHRSRAAAAVAASSCSRCCATRTSSSAPAPRRPSTSPATPSWPAHRTSRVRSRRSRSPSRPSFLELS